MAAFEEGAPAEAAPVPGEKHLMLFTGRANPGLAAATAKELGIELGAVTLKTFTAGECYCRFDESVHAADVFIIQPTCATPHTGVTPNDAIDIGRDAIVVSLKLGGPIMLLALVVGIVISLFQALTQIQETTLTFVPKIVAILLAMMLLLPFMLSTLVSFTERLFDRVVSG